ncbi:MAG: FHA domain-containing protein [Oscillochloris sp.]|nr:FHA domain-containing protein [Oscillochloris sp.]
MRRLVFRLVLGMCLGAIPAVATAQQSATPILDQRLYERQLELLVHCNAGNPDYRLQVGNRNLEPPAITQASPPPSVIFLIEEGPALDLPGTPARTRRADALALSMILLERLPDHASAGVIFYDQQARTLSEPTSPPAAHAALLRATPAVTPATIASFGAALSNALDAFVRTPAGPQLVVILAAEQLDLPGGAAPPDLPLLLIDLAQTTTEAPNPMAEALGAQYLAYGTQDPTQLSSRLEAVVQAFDSAITPSGYLQLSTILPADLAGAHMLQLNGCQQSAEIRFDLGSQDTNRHWMLLLLVPLPLLGLLIRRRLPKAATPARIQPQLSSGPRTVTTSFQIITDTPTERHGSIPNLADEHYSLELWDSNRCTNYPCNGRQWTIGRNQGCDIRIDSPWLSGLHARIAVTAGGLEITDLDSANGTFVGAERRRLIADMPEAIEPGEPIAFGPQLSATIRRVHP